MLIPAFTLELNNPILKGLTAVGKFDGRHPSLTCGTNAGKIFFHSPHEKDPQAQIKFLNINRRISAIACGKMNPKLERDQLLVGAQTNLLAYDVLENSDLFFKDAPDGVNAIVVGRFAGASEHPMALVGGNCSIQGFDHEGNEVYWTVTGDNVSTMTFCDVDEDGDLELLVGSDDFEIRVFRNEEVISETTETDRIVALKPLRRETFGYALANGTIGVYSKPGQRRWRVKSKHEVTAIIGYDLDGDGEPELISGWSNGKFEVRSDLTGEVIYKDHMRDGACVTGILSADYRSDGRTEVIVTSAEGEVRAYLPAGEELDAMGATAIADKLEDETLQELHQRKQELLFELQQYEEQQRKAKSAPDERAAGTLPADTRVSAQLEHAPDERAVNVGLYVNNDAVIKAAVIFADRLFEGGEAVAVHARQPSGAIKVPLQPAKDVAAQLQVRVIAGTRAMTTLHVFELTHQLPKFAMFAPLEVPKGGAGAPKAGVTCVLPGAAGRVREWATGSFHLAAPLDGGGGGGGGGGKDGKDGLELAFTSLRDGRPLWLRMTAEAGGTLHILTEDMDLAGEVLQDLSAALQVVELESLAEFPSEMEAFRGVLLRVDEFNAARLQMTAEMADQSNSAKGLVIKAEDARILGDLKAMRAAYAQLYTLNQELMGEYSKRANNHEQLLAALKEVNHMIQKAAKLRVGAAKARIVSACRAAIKANNIHALFKLIKTGQA